MGSKVTNTDILYGDEKSLTKKIKENGLVDRLKNYGIEKGSGALIEKHYNSKLYKYAEKQYGVDTINMLNLAHEIPNDSNYLKDAIKINNFNDEIIKSDRKYLTKKLFSQFHNEYTQITNIENIKGYFFKNNSEVSQRIANDSDFLNKIKENKHKILNGKDISMEFPRYNDDKKSNFHFAFGHVDIRNGYIDKQGNLRIKMYDTYDFNKENKTPLNKAGRNEMLKGNLIPFFTIHDIIIPKEKIKEIWN